MAIRARELHPKFAARRLEEEYVQPIGIHTTGSTYYVAALAIPTTPGAAIYTGPNYTRQNTNLTMTMILNAASGLSLTATVVGNDQFGNMVTEDITVTDAALVCSTLYCYSKITSVTTKAFTGTVGAATVGFGYPQTGGTIQAGVNGMRIALPARLDSADVLAVRLSTNGTSAGELAFTYVGYPYWCMSTPTGGTLASNPGSYAMLRFVGHL